MHVRDPSEGNRICCKLKKKRASITYTVLEYIYIDIIHAVHPDAKSDHSVQAVPDIRVMLTALQLARKLTLYQISNFSFAFPPIWRLKDVEKGDLFTFSFSLVSYFVSLHSFLFLLLLPHLLSLLLHLLSPSSLFSLTSSFVSPAPSIVSFPSSLSSLISCLGPYRSSCLSYLIFLYLSYPPSTVSFPSYLFSLTSSHNSYRSFCLTYLTFCRFLCTPLLFKSHTVFAPAIC